MACQDEGMSDHGMSHSGMPHGGMSADHGMSDGGMTTDGPDDVSDSVGATVAGEVAVAVAVAFVAAAAAGVAGAAPWTGNCERPCKAFQGRVRCSRFSCTRLKSSHEDTTVHKLGHQQFTTQCHPWTCISRFDDTMQAGGTPAGISWLW